jgi:diadenylate cyclase
MDGIQAALANFGDQLYIVFSSFRIWDFIDIAVVAFLLYHGIRLVRETRAMQLLKGILAIFILSFIAAPIPNANWQGLITLDFFFDNILQVSIFAVVVLFQPELRSALEKMGRSNISALRIGVQSEAQAHDVEALIDVLTKSCVYLSGRGTGALMVIERQTKLGDVVGTGTVIDAAASVELIGNIFFVNSPLHDGAMIVRNGRLYAAGCYLPLSQNMEIGRDLGTRHRAALGMSENSDAVILVVSEETGAISLASESRLQWKLTEEELRNQLELKLIGASAEAGTEKKPIFWRAKK